MILIAVIISSSSFSQNFDGTAFSSSKPFYGEPPYHFEGSEYYTISFKTNPEVIRSLVPEPLVPLSNDVMQVIFAIQKISEPVKLEYNEAFLLIPVSFNEIYGGYIPVLYLDKVETIIGGREIWGFNKVGAEVIFSGDDQQVSVKVTQLDTLLMKASFILGKPFSPPEQSQSGGIINLKYIPAIAKNAPPEVYQLTITPSKEGMADARESKNTLVRSGEAKLEFYSSYYNPYKYIPVLEIIDASYSVISYSLTHGEVIYDYLKEE
jgi:acetoacetate decarboxylase